ncbi:MAG: hypothetical protein RMJ44_00460 [Cytophagales bacterium]|nr:hypothetical protein [Bernardetiaceae bacterium]MDW8209530.1 hypothetical protein [Cytophagales bacterium]
MKQLPLLFLIAMVYGQEVAFAQTTPSASGVYEGIFIIGYVNRGAFLNFTGPNINFTKGNSKYILGMLPSLRVRQEDQTPRNALVIPSLGAGFTYTYKAFALQVALYYNARTATTNGSWHVGMGIGLRLNYFNKPKKSEVAPAKPN